MSVAQFKLVHDALDKAKADDPNHDYYIEKAREYLASLSSYVDSMEAHIKTLTAQVEIERKG